jgi:hypothetical protein
MSRRRRSRGRQGPGIWTKLIKLSLLLGSIGAAGFYGYEVGLKLSQEKIAGLSHEIERLTALDAGRKDEVAALLSQLDDAKSRADALQAKYDQVALTDEMKDIVAGVKAKMDQGLDAKRLAFVIASADKPKRCTEAATKRFMVKTPHFGEGASTWVRFSDLVTVTAEGESAGGGAEQAFDPDKPVTVHFTAIGGKEATVSGKLPLQHSMVVKTGEYRFTVAPGAKGFVEVTGDRCEYKG